MEEVYKHDMNKTHSEMHNWKYQIKLIFLGIENAKIANQLLYS